MVEVVIRTMRALSIAILVVLSASLELLAQDFRGDVKRAGKRCTTCIA
jgi:hypothetical protein